MGVKLLRTFAAQAEALNRYRNGGKQQVIVQHQHINVAAEKAAVSIGAPLPGVGVAGVTLENERQPHGPEQLTYEPGAPMWSKDQNEGALPVASDEQRQMQDARGSEPRRTEG